MAAGERYISGKPKDIVKHFGNHDKSLCGRRSPGYATMDEADVTCKDCQTLIKNKTKGYLKFVNAG